MFFFNSIFSNCVSLQMSIADQFHMLLYCVLQSCTLHKYNTSWIFFLMSSPDFYIRKQHDNVWCIEWRKLYPHVHCTFVRWITYHKMWLSIMLSTLTFHPESNLSDKAMKYWARIYQDLVIYKRKVNQTCAHPMGYNLLSDISLAMYNRTIPSTALDHLWWQIRMMRFL